MTTRLLVFAPEFYQRCDELAQKYPHYRGKDAIATRYHISNAVIACGFEEVNADNIDQVMQALSKRAESKQAH